VKPIGYFRALEKLLTLMRDATVEDDPKHMQALNDAADAVDQCWADLAKADQLMIYNMARHLTDNIKPATKEPEKPMIQLLH